MRDQTAVVRKGKHEDVELNVTIGTLRKELGKVERYYAVTVETKTFDVYGMMYTTGLNSYTDSKEYHRRERTIERDLDEIANRAVAVYFHDYIEPVRRAEKQELEQREYRRALIERDNWKLEFEHNNSFDNDVAVIRPILGIGLNLGKKADDPEMYRARLAVMQLLAAAPKMEKALILAQKMIEHAHAQFNWGASVLDNESIQLLNQTPIAISEALKAAAGL